MKVFGKEIGKDIKIPPIIDNFFGKLLPQKNSDKEELVSIPSTNISDDETEFELSLALPGMDRDQVEIEIQGNYLIINGKREESQEERNKNWIRTEFVSNAFYRAFALPANADPERIQAKMRNGRLDIRVGKALKSKTKNRTIKIS